MEFLVGPVTGRGGLIISLAEWNATTREPYIHLPLDRHLRLQQIQAPRRIPPRGEETDCLWPPLRKAALEIHGLFPPHKQDQAPLPVTGPTRNSSHITVFISTVNQHNAQCVQLKSGPLTKPWIFHVRCYLQWFCWYDIILLHVQELARLLQKRGEPVLAIRISWISRQWVLVFEQRHFWRDYVLLFGG